MKKVLFNVKLTPIHALDLRDTADGLKKPVVGKKKQKFHFL
jgi:hypothetical protein